MANQRKFPESVMIWGAIGLDYKSGCFHCSHAMDSDEYHSILLRSEFVENLNDRYGAFGWYFMHDGASAHTSRATADFLKVRCLVLPEWPPNSPDLNPIKIGYYERTRQEARFPNQSRTRRNHHQGLGRAGPKATESPFDGIHSQAVNAYKGARTKHFTVCVLAPK
jgi:hypothetical protein